MFTDTHCHIYKEYYEDIDAVFLKAKNCDVNRFFLSGCSDVSNKEILSLLPHENVYGCLGIHPEEALTYKESDLLFLESHLQDAKVIAIGEIGLDYHYTKKNKKEQRELFIKQLQLALKYSLPVVIHSREATEDTINILKQFPSVRGVIHSFSGSLETAQIYIKMGYKLGINGVVTFKNSHLKEILPFVIDSIVLETDSPFLTPHPYRGTQNDPSYIKTIASFLAHELGISLKELATITNCNIFEIFKI